MFATNSGLKAFESQAIRRFKHKVIRQSEFRLLPDQVIAIYRSPGRTSMLAQLFNTSTKIISQIKNQTGEYRDITKRLRRKEAKQYLTGGYYAKVIQY